MKKVFSKFIVVLLIMSFIGGISENFAINVQAKESTAYTIKVNLGTNCTTIYKNGKAVKSMICSPSLETPTGTFYIPVKYRWHEMIGNCYAQYCSRITTGILFHSVWYYKNGDKSTMSVSAYNVMGQKASHGCVRLLCKDAKWIYDHCAVGTKIVIFWGNKKDDPLGRPSFTPIRNGKFTDWDPTDPDPKNPYNKAKPTIKANVKTVEYGTKLKSMTDLVSIQDCVGNQLTKSNATIKVTGKVNTKKLGTYTVKYTVKDSLGNKNTKTFKFKVVDTKKPVIKGAKSKKDVALGSTLNVKKGVTAKSASGKNMTSKIKVTVKKGGKTVANNKGNVKFTKTGTYKITYTVTGKNKKTAKKKVTYKVTDQRVKLKLTASKVTITEGDTFDAYKYISSLTDYKGKNLNKTKNVKISGSVNVTKPGTYSITYTAQNGNKAYTAVTKTLKVVVVKKPAEETTTEPTTETTTEPQEEA